MVVSATAQLDNGLKTVVTELPYLHSTTVAVAIGCGSRHETREKWGLSHLLEHMLFRGSTHYPTAQSLARAFEQAGGVLEAETWRDHTFFSISSHPSKMERILVALADMLIRPQFPQLDIERNIVEAEIKAEIDAKGQDVDVNNISRANIWRRSAMGRRITGSVESIRRFGVDTLREQHRKFYHANNAVLSIAGPLKANPTMDFFADTFGAMPTGAPIRYQDDAVHFQPERPTSCYTQPGTQLSLQLTFDALPEGHPDFTAQKLLANILDDGFTSRLPRALCEEQGLIYELNTGLDCYSDCGLYDIGMYVAPEQAQMAVERTLATLQNILEHGLSKHEVEVARERSMHALEFRNDSTEESAQYACTRALFGTALSHEVEMQRLQEITQQDLQRVARHLFARKPPHVTLVGPTQQAQIQRIESDIERHYQRM